MSSTPRRISDRRSTTGLMLSMLAVIGWKLTREIAGNSFPDYASGPATHPVPALTACVLDNGEVAIFPGTAETCIGLGLGNAIL